MTGWKRERLNGMFGVGSPGYMFQVLLMKSDFKLEPEEFEKIWTEHGDNEIGCCQLPATRHGRVTFANSYNFLMNGSPPTMRVDSFEVLYTEPNYKFKNNAAQDHTNPQLISDLDNIRTIYLDLIERHRPDIKFGEAGRFLNKDFGLDFVFALQPFDPQLYKQGEERKLLPVRSLGGAPIVPPQKLSGFSFTP